VYVASDGKPGIDRKEIGGAGLGLTGVQGIAITEVP
jgi:hypothetical protein